MRKIGCYKRKGNIRLVLQLANGARVARINWHYRERTYSLEYIVNGAVSARLDYPAAEFGSAFNAAVAYSHGSLKGFQDAR
jgi:hypothetical protein